MPDRLEELRRQRTLVAEHLAWLDREIAAKDESIAIPRQPTEAPSAAPQSVPAVADNGSTLGTVTRSTSLEVQKAPEVPDALKVLAELDATKAPKPEAPTQAIAPELRSEHRPADIKDDVRRGCFFYAAIATLLVVGGGALLIWVAREYNKAHPPKPKVEQVEEFRP